MFPLILTVLFRDDNRGSFVPVKDCLYKGNISSLGSRV